MPELYPQDQKKVNEFLTSNVNRVERSPFRPLRLLAVLVGVLLMLMLVAYIVARGQGVI